MRSMLYGGGSVYNTVLKEYSDCDMYYVVYMRMLGISVCRSVVISNIYRGFEQYG